MNLRVRLDRTCVDSGKTSVRYALVTIEAPAAPRHSTRPPATVAFVLDRSGSMAGQKLVLARRAVRDALRLLHGDDRFALVVYDDHVDLLYGLAPASREAKAAAMRCLAGIEARGSTDLASGWQRGVQEIGDHLQAGASGRILLLTDGLANVGLTDPATLAACAGERRAHGVRTSTFGVGADFDEQLLQQMAAAGGGHFYFIERAEQIPDLLTSELGETLEVIAHDAALVFQAGDGIEVAPLGGFLASAAGHVTRIELGDLVSEQELTVVVKLTVTGQQNLPIPVVVKLTAKDDTLGREELTIAFRPTWPQEVGAESRDPIVVRAVAEQLAALAQLKALELNGLGDYDGARRVLREAAEAILTLAEGDQTVLAIANSVRGEDEEFAACLRPMERKRRYFSANATMASRGPEGKARRRPHT